MFYLLFLVVHDDNAYDESFEGMGAYYLLRESRRLASVLTPLPSSSIASLSPQETRNAKVAAEEKDIRLYGGMMFENNSKRMFVNKLVSISCCR